MEVVGVALSGISLVLAVYKYGNHPILKTIHEHGYLVTGLLYTVLSDARLSWVALRNMSLMPGTIKLWSS
jgi:hypothetical protein